MARRMGGDKLNSINIAIIAISVVSCFSMFIVYLTALGIRRFRIQSKRLDNEGSNTEIAIDVNDKKKSR